MAWVTLTQFKDYLREEKATADDATLTSCLAAAHQTIRNECQRDFTVASASSTRSYVPNGTSLLDIHDCTAVTAVTLNGATLDTATYQLEPVALDWTNEDSPYTQIRRLLSAWWVIVPDKAAVTVTATWGWLATPDPVFEATKVIAKDILANRNISLGIVAFSEAGAASARTNSFVRQVVRDYRSKKVWGIA